MTCVHFPFKNMATLTTDIKQEIMNKYGIVNADMDVYMYDKCKKTRTRTQVYVLMNVNRHS